VPGSKNRVLSLILGACCAEIKGFPELPVPMCDLLIFPRQLRVCRMLAADLALQFVPRRLLQPGRLVGPPLGPLEIVLAIFRSQEIMHQRQLGIQSRRRLELLYRLVVQARARVRCKTDLNGSNRVSGRLANRSVPVFRNPVPLSGAAANGW